MDVRCAEFGAIGLQVRNLVWAYRHSCIRRVRIAEAVLDGVMVISTPLAVVGSVRLIPSLGVHDTELSLRLAVLQQQVRCNELAELELGDVLWRVLGVVDILRITSCSAEPGVISTGGEELVAHVSISVDAVKWCVDGHVFQDGGGRVALDLLDRSSSVAIAAGIDHLTESQ